MPKHTRPLHLAAVALVSLALALSACSKPEQASTQTTTAEASTKVSTVAISLDDKISIGALQLEISYTGSGRFVGDADAVECKTLAKEALSSYNNKPDEKILRAAYVAVKGFEGPLRLAECQFKGAVQASDFTIEVRDSAKPDLSAIDPAPSLSVVID